MKRKTAVYILAAVTAFSLAACGQTGGGGTQTAALQESSAAPAEEAAAADGTAGEESASVAEEASAGDTASATEGAAGTEEEGTTGSNILIAYFTVPETDGVDTMAGASRVVVDGEVLGNNQYIAQLIQGEVGGDLYAIETVQEYPGSHDPLLEYAYTEKAENARPELAGQIENLEDYDVIFLGYPNWNADLPMPLYTFLEQYDFSGKTIIPFTTHGGSGFSRTIQTIQELQPGATIVEDGLSISRNNVPEAQSAVTDWIAGLSY